MSPRAIAIVDSVVRKQRTAGDTLLALHKWIAKDIRYVSVALGLGGYQPRFPDSTIVSGFGDCKDKATLFIAAARHLGLTAYPVLLNSTGVSDRTVVSINQFDHAIAAMPKKTGGYTFLDLTTNVFPPGKVPPSYQDEFGLVVLPDGKGDEITFPKDDPSESLSSFEGTATADGMIGGTLSFAVRGSAETALRADFVETPDSAQRANMSKAIGGMFLNSVVDTLMLFDGRDPKVEAKFSVRLHGGDAIKRAGAAAVLTIPPSFRGPSYGMAALARQLSNAEGERKYPIDADKVMGLGKTSSELKLTLPEGWKAMLPKPVIAKSDFGEYQSEYSQDGRVLRIAFRTVGTSGVFPKERIADLKAWLKLIADDRIESIVLIPPPTP